MAKIDRVADLPEWFDLVKYRATEFFNAERWNSQLSIRKDILTSDELETRDGEVTSYNKSLQMLRLEPVNEKYAKGGFSVVHSYMSARQWQPVRPLKTWDLIRQYRQDKWGGSNGLCDARFATRWDLIRLPNEETLKSANRDIASMPIEIGDYGDCKNVSATLLIDLGAPDSIIKESFASWLKEARLNRPKANQPRKMLYDRWARYGLLPYLDLLIWSIETGTHIPDRVMSAAISGYDAGEANLRKTVAPLAEALMGDLSELRALAAIEAAKTPTEPETFEG